MVAIGEPYSRSLTSIPVLSSWYSNYYYSAIRPTSLTRKMNKKCRDYAQQKKKNHVCRCLRDYRLQNIIVLGHEQPLEMDYTWHKYGNAIRNLALQISFLFLLLFFRVASGRTLDVFALSAARECYFWVLLYMKEKNNNCSLSRPPHLWHSVCVCVV